MASHSIVCHRRQEQYALAWKYTTSYVNWERKTTRLPRYWREYSKKIISCPLSRRNKEMTNESQVIEKSNRILDVILRHDDEVPSCKCSFHDIMKEIFNGDND